MTLEDFMRTESYVKYLDELDKALPEKIDRVSKIHEVIMEVEKESLECASVSPEELDELIRKHPYKTISYIIKKHENFFEPDGGEDNIFNKPPQLNYPIGHLIEYYLLLNTPEDLQKYIKGIGMPNAKKYAKELTDIYSSIQ